MKSELGVNRGRRTRKMTYAGHTVPRPPVISLHQPGRLRVANVIALLGVSHSSLYAGMRVHRYPRADGYDGVIPYWNTSTIHAFLAGEWSAPC